MTFLEWRRFNFFSIQEDSVFGKNVPEPFGDIQIVGATSGNGLLIIVHHLLKRNLFRQLHQWSHQILLKKIMMNQKILSLMNLKMMIPIIHFLMIHKNIKTHILELLQYLLFIFLKDIQHQRMDTIRLL
ncbi:unnamed protein product, partial [Trichogramma brassicae]